MTLHAIDGATEIWEMHPNGDEIVCVMERAGEVVLEQAGEQRKVDLGESGAYAVVPRGTWHTVTAHGVARMLFITAGEGTQHR